MNKRTLLLAGVVTAASLVPTATADAASILLQGPASIKDGTTATYGVAADPSGVADTAPQVVVGQFDAASVSACPAGPGSMQTQIVFKQSIDPAAGPAALQFTLSPSTRVDSDRTTPRQLLCAWLASTEAESSAYAGPSALTWTRIPQDYRKRKPTIVTSYGYNSDRKKCRILVDVMLDGRVDKNPKSVVVQRKKGKKFVNVGTIRLDGNFAGARYIPAKRGDVYRAVFAGNEQILPGVSKTHRLKPVENRC